MACLYHPYFIQIRQAFLEFNHADRRKDERTDRQTDMVRTICINFVHIVQRTHQKYTKSVIKMSISHLKTVWSGLRKCCLYQIYVMPNIILIQSICHCFRPFKNHTQALIPFLFKIIFILFAGVLMGLLHCKKQYSSSCITRSAEG